MRKILSVFLILTVLAFGYSAEVARAGSVLDSIGGFIKDAVSQIGNVVAVAVTYVLGPVGGVIVSGVNSFCVGNTTLLGDKSTTFGTDCAGGILQNLSSNFNSCASKITFNDLPNPAGVSASPETDNPNSQIAVYRFTVPDATDNNHLAAWIWDVIPGQVGKGLIDWVNTLYFPALDYCHRGRINYVAYGAGNPSFIPAAGYNPDLACPTIQTNNSSDAQVAPYALIHRKDRCTADGVCDFTDPSIPAHSYVAYIFKTLGNYTYAGTSFANKFMPIKSPFNSVIWPGNSTLKDGLTVDGVTYDLPNGPTLNNQNAMVLMKTDVCTPPPPVVSPDPLCFDGNCVPGSNGTISGGGSGSSGASGKICSAVNIGINSIGATTYNLYRDGQLIAANQPTTGSAVFTDQGLSPHGKYSYRVVVSNDGGNAEATATFYNKCLPQCTFGADKNSIPQYSTDNLDWRCQLADLGCKISDTGANTVLIRGGDSGKVQTPKLGGTTTYKLSCSNADGENLPLLQTINVRKPTFCELNPADDSCK